MPTGYTNTILEGATFEEFVWTAARGMGAFIMQRDDGFDAPPVLVDEPSDWNAKELAKAEARLDEFTKATPAERRAMWAATKAEKDKARAESAAKDAEQRAKYEAVLSRVRDWTPPTPGHEGLKKFMVDQITESIRFDCPPPESVPSLPDFYAIEPFGEWQMAELKRRAENVAYHRKGHAEEVERCRQRTEWKQALAASVPVPEKFRK